MLCLAVETSCDDTAVALMEGSDCLSHLVSSQTEHAEHGGVVPELASRAHLEMLPRMAASLLRNAGTSLRELRLVTATAGPGLVGSLLVGLSWAKSLAYALGTPFLAINHLAAHLHVHHPAVGSDAMPAIGLLVSGGHTCLFLMRDWDDILLLGATRDDSAGEAFDKCAKMLGLGFPGGARLDGLADTGDDRAVDLPSPLSDPASPEFSFSGLKTAAALTWERGCDARDLAASFRRVVVELLVSKTIDAASSTGCRTVLLAGGVAANSLLRKRLRKECERTGFELHVPPSGMSTDNAVMVGRAAHRVVMDHPGDSSALSCNCFARWDGAVLETLVRS